MRRLIAVFFIEMFTCLMYGKKRSNKINEVRTEIFMQKYKPEREYDKISCAKKLDGSMFPPCSRVLWEKIRRTYYIAQLWMSDTELEDNCYRIQLYKGEASPRVLEMICEDNQERQHRDPSEAAELENNEAITQKKGIEYSEEEG